MNLTARKEYQSPDGKTFMSKETAKAHGFQIRRPFIDDKNIQPILSCFTMKKSDSDSSSSILSTALQEAPEPIRESSPRKTTESPYTVTWTPPMMKGGELMKKLHELDMKPRCWEPNANKQKPKSLWTQLLTSGPFSANGWPKKTIFSATSKANSKAHGGALAFTYPSREKTTIILSQFLIQKSPSMRAALDDPDPAAVKASQLMITDINKYLNEINKTRGARTTENEKSVRTVLLLYQVQICNKSDYKMQHREFWRFTLAVLNKAQRTEKNRPKRMEQAEFNAAKRNTENLFLILYVFQLFQIKQLNKICFLKNFRLRRALLHAQRGQRKKFRLTDCAYFM
jgi:hypothetical protein